MPHQVDIHVGKRIRHRRWLIGATQQKLANQVGIKFQQIQKYETGANRVSASRLWDIAAALDVPVQFFFDGLDQIQTGQSADVTPQEAALIRDHRTLPPETQAAIQSIISAAIKATAPCPAPAIAQEA